MRPTPEEAAAASARAAEEQAERDNSAEIISVWCSMDRTQRNAVLVGMRKQGRRLSKPDDRAAWAFAAAALEELSNVRVAP